jgi:tRNA(Ile)-lysidine synthase
MRGKKKVSDLFTDLKVDCQQKQQAFILTSQDNIVWVVGYRSDNRFKIDQTTTEYFRICR